MNKNIAGVVNFLPGPAGTNGELTAGAIAAATVSYVIPIVNVDNLIIQATFGGTATGATKVELSLNYRAEQDGTVIVAGNWTDITANAVAKVPFVTKYGTDPAGTAPNIVYVIQQCPGAAIKFTYTHASGTGTIDAWYAAKGI